MLQTLKELKMELLDKKLIFEQNFLAYLESSNFVFKFFNELAQAKVRITDIPQNDTYGEYDDHLKVLQSVYNAYINKLNMLQSYDGLLVPDEAKIILNTEFISSFSKIDIYLDGILSAFELDLLHRIADITPLSVFISVDVFNVNLVPFSELKTFGEYEISLPDKKITLLKKQQSLPQIQAYFFSQRISQVAFVFAKVKELIAQGAKQENIALIVPDEHFSAYINLFDTHNNFNYAMGVDITKLSVFKALQELLDSADSSLESNLDLKNLLDFIKQVIANFLFANDIIPEADSKHFTLLNSSELYLLEQIFHIIFEWENGIIDYRQWSKTELIAMLLEQIKTLRVDDVKGGRIKVMGILESRGYEIEHIIVVDFNDNFVPTISDSDMFLNSFLRQKLKIPTTLDKQNLQQHYYFQAFSKAKSIHLSFVKQAKQDKSFMLDSLALNGANITYSDGDSLFMLLKQGEIKPYVEDEIKGFVDKNISPSKIKTLLQCPRKYHFAHQKKLQIQKDKNAIIGELMHKCLQEVYTPFVGKNVTNSDVIESIKNYQLDSQYNAMEMAEFEMCKNKLCIFLVTHNQNRVSKIIELEEPIIITCSGFTIKAKSDRVEQDVESKKLRVIDYKYSSTFLYDTKNIDKNIDFAINIYAKYYGDDVLMEFWNIKNNEIIKLDSSNMGFVVLGQKLKEFSGEISFAKSQASATSEPCLHCEYKRLCNKM